ncbi:MAG: ExbD/TolR family protein [Planctomycetota bacterium]
MTGVGRLAVGGLTPLLDTLFLLLFALLAVSDVKRADTVEQEVLVALPAVAEDAAGRADETVRISVTVDAESRLFVGDSELPVTSASALDRALVEASEGSNASAVTIEVRADRDSRSGVTTALLQRLRSSGFEDVVLVAIGASEGFLAEEFGLEGGGSR